MNADSHRYPYSSALFDSLSLGIVFQDAEGRIISCNPAAETILGLSLDQMRGITSIDPRWNAVHEDGSPFPGEDHPAMIALRTQKPVQNVVMGVFNPKIEARTWINVRAFPIEVESDSSVCGAYAVFEDISERVSAQKKVVESETRFHSLFEAMSEGMALHRIVYDADGLATDYLIVDVNPAFERQTGMLGTAVIGKLASEAYGAGEAPFLNVYAKVVLTGEPTEIEQYFPPLQKHFNIKVFSPGQEHFATVFEDITERKQAQATIEEWRSRYEAVIKASGMLLYDWNTLTNAVTYAGDIQRFLEFSVDEMAGGLAHWVQLIHPEDRDGFGREIERVIASKEAFHQEYRVRRRDGSYLSVHDEGYFVLDARGGITQMVGFVHNITAQKQAEVESARLEARLRESQKMEALGTLAGGVAHDFNNALATILGNLELARQDVGTDHPSLVSLDEIGKASRRAKDLVQQILAFGRRQKVERKPMSLALVVVETARLVRATLSAMVSLNVDCAGDTPAVLADATQIEQVLLNLCSNAAYAVEDIGRTGVIEINLSAYGCTQSKTHDDLAPGRYACLTVRDNGFGMDETTRSRIFDPFFTTKPRGKGTGLGLSVVHGIVLAHDAHIEVDSASGEGSTFRIYFPAVETHAISVAAPAPEVAPIQGQGKHVLYLDDEQAIIFLMKRLLERQGFRVSGFTDPREALAAVRANPEQFYLAVTDYNMPGMSGLEVASALREIRSDLPVVLASGYITEELRQKAPAVGVRELIYKPNTVDDLCAAVARCANAQSGNKGSS